MRGEALLAWLECYDVPACRSEQARQIRVTPKLPEDLELRRERADNLPKLYHGYFEPCSADLGHIPAQPRPVDALEGASRHRIGWLVEISCTS